MAKVMISLPDDLLARIDREAGRRKSSRSALLRAGALRELGRPDPESLDEAVSRARAALSGAGGFESADVIREGRDEQDRHDRSRL
jgi:hypothetical protein